MPHHACAPCKIGASSHCLAIYFTALLRLAPTLLVLQDQLCIYLYKWALTYMHTGVNINVCVLIYQVLPEGWIPVPLETGMRFVGRDGLIVSTVDQVLNHSCALES